MEISIGERLKQLRESMNMTQEEFSEFAKIGRPNLAKYETGKSEPSVSVLVRIADATGKSVDYLLGRTDETDTEQLDIPEPTTLAAHATEGMPPVTAEEMQEVIKKAYLLLMQEEMKKKE